MRQKVNGKSFTLIALMIVALFVAAAFTFGITAPPTSSNNQQTITLTHPSQKVDQLTAMANTPDRQLQPAQFLPGQQQAWAPEIAMTSGTPNTLSFTYAVYRYSPASGEPPNYYLIVNARADTALFQQNGNDRSAINTDPNGMTDRGQITKYYGFKENVGPTDGTSTIKSRPLNLRV